MRMFKKAWNGQSARNVETRCFSTTELTNLISGCVTAWPAGTRDMSADRQGSDECERQSKYTVDETPDCEGPNIADTPGMCTRVVYFPSQRPREESGTPRRTLSGPMLCPCPQFRKAHQRTELVSATRGT